VNSSRFEIDVWKRVLKTGVRIYPDGFYRLTGILSRSTTFGRLKATKQEIQVLCNANGSIKEPWLTRLAHFMRNCRSRDSVISDNHVLVVLGIMYLIKETKKC
jgi:hypothetical protein